MNGPPIIGCYARTEPNKYELISFDRIAKVIPMITRPALGGLVEAYMFKVKANFGSDTDVDNSRADRVYETYKKYIAYEQVNEAHVINELVALYKETEVCF